MEHQRELMKALREFAMADPEDCDGEWDAYQALLKKGSSSVSSPTSSTSHLPHRPRASAAAVTPPSTTKSTASLRAPRSAPTSSAAYASSDLTKDDLSPGARRMYDYLIGATDSLDDPAAATSSSTSAPAISPTNEFSLKRDSTTDDLSPGARCLCDVLVGGSASPTSAASPRASSSASSTRGIPESAVATAAVQKDLHSVMPSTCSAVFLEDDNTMSPISAAVVSASTSASIPASATTPAATSSRGVDFVLAPPTACSTDLVPEEEAIYQLLMADQTVYDIQFAEYDEKYCASSCRRSSDQLAGATTPVAAQEAVEDHSTSVAPSTASDECVRNVLPSTKAPTKPELNVTTIAVDIKGTERATKVPMECTSHDASVSLAVLTPLAVPTQPTTTSVNVSEVGEYRRKRSSVSLHHSKYVPTSLPLMTTTAAGLALRPVPWPSFEYSQVWNQSWSIPIRERNSGFMSKLMGITSGDDTKFGDVTGWSDLNAIDGYHRVKPTVFCMIIASPVEQDPQSDCHSYIPDDALMDRISVTFLESVVQLLLSQINFGGAVHIQFHGPLCEVPGYWSMPCLSEYQKPKLGSRILTNTSVWSHLKLELILWLHPVLESWFQFCSGGKASLYVYGAASFQWEIAWPTTTLTYSVHCVGLLNEVLVQEWLICFTGDIIKYGFGVNQLMIAWLLHVECSANSDKSGQLLQSPLPPTLQPVKGSQRKWNAHWFELTEDGDLFERIKVVKLKPACPPPHVMCMTLSMGNPPRFPCLHVIVIFRSTVSVLRYLHRGNSVELRPPWSLLATINSILVTVPEVHTTNISAELIQFGVATSHGSKAYNCLDSERQYIADQIVNEGATYFGSQLFEWQIPCWDKTSTIDSVPVIKDIPEVWVLHIPPTSARRVLISWDPGGSVASVHDLYAATVVNWNRAQLAFSHLTWDPGGYTQHRLEGKPNLKEGGLSATCLHELFSGPTS